MTRPGQRLGMKRQAGNLRLKAPCLRLLQKEVEQMTTGIHLSMIETPHEITENETGRGKGRGSERQIGGTKIGNETNREIRNVTAPLLLDEHRTICSITVPDRNIIHFSDKLSREALTRYVFLPHLLKYFKVLHVTNFLLLLVSLRIKMPTPQLMFRRTQRVRMTRKVTLAVILEYRKEE